VKGLTGNVKTGNVGGVTEERTTEGADEWERRAELTTYHDEAESEEYERRKIMMVW